MSWRRQLVWAAVAAIGWPSIAAAQSAAPPDSAGPASAAKPWVMVVMDPLALPLSCPCVKGYAQRDYDALAAELGKRLDRPIEVVYSESLKVSLGKSQGRAHLVVGKHSVVLFDAKATGLACTPIASLSGEDGAITQTGLIVVPAKDAAKTVAELRGYRIIFGPPECDEKHAAALALLEKHGIDRPAKLETAPGCDDGCTQILELPAGEHGAAVISSYAKPLLEGCGTVPKHALRVVGETAPIAFVEAFATAQLTPAESAQLLAALVAATQQPALRIKLETRRGFVALAPVGEPTAKAGELSAKKK
ncbi:MAG TPA: PhnD/SsuA/transferrin family substrate-binding protein [Pirellulales bacterium]